MNTILAAAALALLAINLVLLLLVLRRSTRADTTPLRDRLAALEQRHDRTEAAVRDDAERHARGLREELGASSQRAGESLLTNLGEMTRTQKSQFDSLLDGLARMHADGQTRAKQLREEVGGTVKGLSDSVVQSIGQLTTAQHERLESFASGLAKLTESNEARLDALRGTVDEKLREIRSDNTRQLEQMRATVDEKLQGALEKRLGESFRLVSERLEQVQKGLGEMQSLASGVGDLKRVLTNVKARGTWGEVQLAALLEDVLTPEQYAANVATREGSAERVEFAIRLPNPDTNDGTLWLPIDAKFPREDYERLCDAQEHGDVEAVEVAARALGQRVRACAREIRDKYLNPPKTTDFGILFLPTEGLYAEVIRRAGLVTELQRDCRVVVAGPSTLAALLNALRMGFRTLAIQQRSSEVWEVLGVVKTEFEKFGAALDKVRKKLHEASGAVDKAVTRRRVMDRKLRAVEVAPAAGARLLLTGSEGGTPLPVLDAAEIAATAAVEPA